MTPFDYLTILHGDAAPAQDNADNIVVSFKRGGGKPFDNRAFALSDLGAAARLIDEQSASDADAYAALGLYRSGRRTKNAVRGSQWLWLDRDDKPRKRSLPAPTLIIETSPGRYQDFWQVRSSRNQRWSGIQWPDRRCLGMRESGSRRQSADEGSRYDQSWHW